MDISEPLALAKRTSQKLVALLDAEHTGQLVDADSIAIGIAAACCVAEYDDPEASLVEILKVTQGRLAEFRLASRAIGQVS